MSLTQPIMNLEKTSSIPQGSTFVVEMGDGSGTKAVTKENLEKSTGEALKIGNLEDLQTENTENLVAAINEAAQSGGGGSAVDILDTKEEIEANTESGKAAGAQAVKAMFGELNDNFTYSTDEQAIGTWIDGKPLYRVVFPFGALPNNTRKTVNSPVSNIDKVISLDGFISTVDGAYYPLPYVNTGSAGSIGFWYQNNAVTAEAGANRSNCDAVVIMKYTKTTD